MFSWGARWFSKKFLQSENFYKRMMNVQSCLKTISCSIFFLHPSVSWSLDCAYVFFTDKLALTSFRGKRLLCFKLKIQRLFVNRRREMVSFELGKEKAENVFSSCHERGPRNPKVWGSISRRDSKFFLCSTIVTRRKASFSISLPSTKLTISLNLSINMTLSTLLILTVCRTRVIWTS